MRNRHGARSTNPVTKSGVRTRPIVRRPPGMALTKKYARSRKDVNKRLSNLRTAVKKLQVRTYGEKQLADQAFYHTGAPPVHPGLTPNIYDLCAEQPLMFCVQSINRGAAVWQLKYTPSAAAGTRFAVSQVGGFDRQAFALTQLNADPTLNNDTRYRTTEFWKNSLGVQAKYLLKDTYYEFDISAAGVTGYVELCAVSHRRNFPIAKATNYSFPDSLKSYINTCTGSNDRNVTSFQQTTVKCLKRLYFQYPSPDANAPAPPDPPVNPPEAPPGGLPVSRAQYFAPRRKIFRIKVKSNNVIAVSIDNLLLDPSGHQVIDWTEIPLEQQTWLMLRTSIPMRNIQTIIPADPPDPSDLNPPGLDYTHRLSLQMRRVVCWRDYQGNSMS